MSGNEIAKLSTVINCDTKGIDQAFKIIKGGLQDTDTKLNNFKTAVANSSKELQKTQLALATYKLQLKQTGDKTQEAKDKLNSMTIAVDRNKVALASNKQALSNYESSIASSGNSAGFFAGKMGLIIGAAAAVGAALGAMIVKTVQISGEFEQLSTSFEVLAGGAEAGDALTKSLIQLATVTPMTSQGLAENAKLLLSFGETNANIVPDLKMLGDVAGGNQEKLNSLALAFAQSGSTGRLMGQDLLQMVNVGFNPLQAISERTGKSMGTLKDEMEKGLIPFSQVRQAFVDVTSEGGRFYGMMEKQSNTLNGRISTMQDNWTLLGKQIGDKFLPMAKAAVEVLIGTADAIGQVLTALSKFTKAIAQPFKIVIKTVYDNLPGAADARKAAARTPKQKMQDQLREEEALAKEYKSKVDKANANAKTAPDAMNKAAYEGYAKEQQGYYNQSLTNIKDYQKKIAQIDKDSKKTKKKATTQTGFVDSDKSGTHKKGKSYDSILSGQADLAKSQSDLDIAQNDYTDAQILQKKIELQRRLISLYKSTSTKGLAEQNQSQTELLNLEKQYEDQVMNDKIAALEQEAALTKSYNAMDTTEKLSNVKLTEEEKLKITNDAKNAELQAEVRLQQAILELKRRGVTDLSQLSQKDREEYEKQLLTKLQAEQNFQQQVVDTAQQGKAAEVAAAKELSSTITDGFRGMINGTYSVQQAFGSMLENIALKIAQSGIENMLTNLFKGAGGGSKGVVSTFLGGINPMLGSFADLFSAHANGGNPDSTRPFIAGERGAELVVPTNKTKVFTNQETKGILGGGGGDSQGQSVQPIIVSNTFKVETMNGDNAIKTLQKPESKAAIVKMMGEALDYNQGGFRTKVKNV